MAIVQKRQLSQTNETNERGEHAYDGLQKEEELHNEKLEINIRGTKLNSRQHCKCKHWRNNFVFAFALVRWNANARCAHARMPAISVHWQMCTIREIRAMCAMARAPRIHSCRGSPNCSNRITFLSEWDTASQRHVWAIHIMSWLFCFHHRTARFSSSRPPIRAINCRSMPTVRCLFCHCVCVCACIFHSPLNTAKSKHSANYICRTYTCDVIRGGVAYSRYVFHTFSAAPTVSPPRNKKPEYSFK